MRKLLPLTLVFTLLSVLAFSALKPYSAQAAESNGEIMFILDASSSMLAKDGTNTSRIDKAKSALQQTISGLSPDVKVGLRVYGSEVPDTNKTAGCQDTRLISRPAANNAAAITGALGNIQAKGWTLMGKTLQDVQQDFTGSGPKSVILLSDGIDTCSPPNACEVAKTLSANGVDIKVNTLGLLVNNDARSQLTCIAQNSGGDYYDINDISRLQSTLNSLTAREVSLFTAAGTPIKGTLRIDDAPLMLANTSYTDTIVIPQELYYSFEALPKQKVTLTVKAVGRDLPIKNLDFLYLMIGGYDQATAEKFNTLPSQARVLSSQVTNGTYTFDAAKEGITKPTLVAFKVFIDPRNSSHLEGSSVPLELKVTTEGGVAPNNKSADTNSAAATGDSNSGSTLTTVLLTLLAVAVLAAIAYAVKRFMDVRRRQRAAVAPVANSENATQNTMPTQNDDSSDTPKTP